LWGCIGSLDASPDHCRLIAIRGLTFISASLPIFRSRAHDAVIRAYDEAGNVIETHEHKSGFKEW
jgi:hypothetical protein